MIIFYKIQQLNLYVTTKSDPLNSKESLFRHFIIYIINALRDEFKYNL